MVTMASKDFEIINHTADVGVVAYGANLSQAFTNAARALFSLITEPESVEETLSWDIELRAPDEESLLVEWLNELIYLFDTEHILFRRFEISELGGGRLKARGYGERVNSSRHQLKTGVKAATYHMLSVSQDEDNVYRVKVIFDI
jgi:SHS2 domain-containing protein